MRARISNYFKRLNFYLGLISIFQTVVADIEVVEAACLKSCVSWECEASRNKRGQIGYMTQLVHDRRSQADKMLLLATARMPLEV